MSDTIVLTKVFEIGFNEDCKRFNSQATIAFVDTLGNLPKGVKVYFNDIYSGDNLYKVSSEKLVQDISVKIKLDPELGKQSLFGSIVLISDDIDIINESSMDGAEVLIGNWKAEQKIGWPVILWIIWIIIFCILLILSLILFFLILLILFRMGSAIINGVKSIFANKEKERRINQMKQIKIITPSRPYYRKEIDEVFNKVKAKLHAAAQQKGGGVALFTDCYTGKILRGGEAYDFEHVRSSEELFMKYRDCMTNEQIAEVVNCEGNVKVTTRAINQSKGKRMFEVWCTPENRIKYDISEKVSAKTLLEADASIKRKANEILS